MATLVLTTVGGIVGGPIGAALGGAIGQSLDRTLLFKPKGREGPRLTELAVQTSSYGRPIPQLFGRLRVAGQVIWSTDLFEHRTRQGGGKGRPSTTTYSYSASFAVALASRPIAGVGRIWADGNLLRGAAGDWKVPVTFRLHKGGEDQPADPLIASAEGIGATPAHRGVAYAVFEDLPLESFGNRIPSLTFEVVADPSAPTIGAIARAIGGDTIVGTGPAMPVDGFSAYGDDARGVAELLANVAGGWFVPRAEGVEMRASGVADHVIAAEGGQRRIVPIGRVPRTVSVAHYDPARDWQTGVQHAVRSGAGGATSSVEAPLALDAGAARVVAERMLARALTTRTVRDVRTDLSALHLGPGWIVTIAGESGTWRIVSATLERHEVALSLVPLEPEPIAIAASGGRIVRAADDPAGTTILHAFETIGVGDGATASQPSVTIVAGGSAAGWRRAAIEYSRDTGATWIAAGTAFGGAAMGSLLTPLRAGSSLLVDRATAIDIVLTHDGMTLLNADVTSLDLGANLALVGDELLQFGTAEQIDARTWRLRELWRGRGGTRAAGAAGGARFVMIDGEGLLRVTLDAAPGTQLRFAARGVGDTVAVERDLVITGAAMLPLPPVHLMAARRGDGTVRLTWRRRSRSDWRWRDGVDAALGEEREAYRITIGDSGAPIEATVSWCDLPSGVFASGAIPVHVSQIGTYGASAAATIIVQGEPHE
ncbi:phage tail protein [Sphingomonas sp. TZW2008]|uniref:phage tail protein n=1 Tax=Sphingomonas sp. TZW2008 TaxID=1917973 RepID=UPI000A2729EC|nr:phage tail protein [Sphingomonas sp. TZW2008]